MARGFLSGVIWGAVVSAAGLAALSLSAPLPDRPSAAPVATPDAAPTSVAPDAPTPEASAPAANPEPADTTTPLVATAPEPETVPDPGPDLSQPGRRPDPEAGIERPAAPAGSLAAPSDPVVVGADTTPLAPPVVGAAPEAPEGGLPAAQGATVRVGSDAPLQPPLPSPAPGAPRPEAQPVIVTGPSQPPSPQVPVGESALAPETSAAPLAPAPEAAAPSTPEPVAATAAPEPETPVEPSVAEAPVAPAPAEPVAEEPVAEAPAAPGAELAAVEPEPEVVPEPDPEAVPEPVLESVPAVGKPARSLVARPGAAVPETAEAPPADETPLPPALAALPAESPLVRFAAPSEAPADVPRMAVVLIDDGSGPLGPDGLESFPFPVSFAIPSSHPRAAEAAAGYRRLGFEVMALAEVPEGATATDVEVTLAGLVRAVPEAVALLETPAGGLQASREVSDQVTAFVGASGHGVVMQPNGLNTAQKLALRDGVPAVTLFRDIDGEGQDAGAIRRTLDQAAFRARQEGGVVMLGRLRADTISALVLWGLQDRSGTIALVPVSTVLSEALAASR